MSEGVGEARANCPGERDNKKREIHKAMDKRLRGYLVGDELDPETDKDDGPGPRALPNLDQRQPARNRMRTARRAKKSKKKENGQGRECAGGRKHRETVVKAPRVKTANDGKRENATGTKKCDQKAMPKVHASTGVISYSSRWTNMCRQSKYIDGCGLIRQLHVG